MLNSFADTVGEDILTNWFSGVNFDFGIIFLMNDMKK
jgi:hypothetical protein